MFLAGRVFAAGQQTDSRRDRYDTCQLNASRLSYDISALDGQGRGDITVPGVDGNEPTDLDPCLQSIDVKNEGQAELDCGHMLIVIRTST